MLSLILICFIALNKKGVKRTVFFFLSIIKLIDLEQHVIWLFGVTAPLNITTRTSKLIYFANGRKGKFIAWDQGSECLPRFQENT